MPLVAEPANNAGAPAVTAPAGLPANDARLRRIEKTTERSANWLQISHAYTPYGRDFPPAKPAQSGEPGERTHRRQCHRRAPHDARCVDA
eukprot:8522091-Pyramimonas_sp.AAC.1